MTWWLQIGGQTSTGKASGSGCQAARPAVLWECNAIITEAKAQKGKYEPDARLCVLDAIDGYPQPDQHGRDHRRLRRGSAHPFSRPAFLRPVSPLPFAYDALWNMGASQLIGPCLFLIICEVGCSFCARTSASRARSRLTESTPARVS